MESNLNYLKGNSFLIKTVMGGNSLPDREFNTFPEELNILISRFGKCVMFEIQCSDV